MCVELLKRQTIHDFLFIIVNFIAIEEDRHTQLARKYSQIWIDKVLKSRGI